LNISLRIPAQPDSGLIGQILFVGFCIPMFLMRKLPFMFVWREMEFWCLVLTLFVLQVYMRNPVGMNIFGGESVGGKPYATFAICLVSGILLSGLRVPVSDLKWVLRLSILGGLLNLAVSIVGTLVPAIGFYTGASKVRSDQPSYLADSSAGDGKIPTRVGFLVAFGTNLALWISSYISPLRACLSPLWGGLVLLAIAAAAMSGFRNTVVIVGFTFIFGIVYRNRFSGLAISIFGLICALALIAVVNIYIPLPQNIQRSLTFLPGTWEERYRKDAELSSEWRFEIWREVLLTNRWIENKWIGDGLGFKASELARQVNMNNARIGVSGFDYQREAILANGNYHSGPVQTIRTIGYIGLIFLLIAQIRLAVHAHRQIQRCRNTEWFPLALFIGIPLVISPIIFVFIFGTFASACVSLFIGHGMIRLLENNLPIPAYVIRRWEPYVLRTRPRLAEVAVER